MGKFKEFLKEAEEPGLKLKYRFKEVGGYFSLLSSNVVSLEGCPEKVGGDFICSDNKLTSLEGAPKEVGGIFYCGGNPGPNGNGFSVSDVEKICKVDIDIDPINVW